MSNINKQLNMEIFNDKDFLNAKLIAARLGRNDNNCVYTSTSAIIGLEYLPRENGDKKVFFISKTTELGYIVVSTLEDLGLLDLVKD